MLGVLCGFLSLVLQGLLDQGHQVAGIDSLNDYYDPTLKTAQLDRLMAREGLHSPKVKLKPRFVGGSVCNRV